MPGPAIHEADGTEPSSADVSFPSLDGTPLMGRYWATSAPRAVLLISHGLGEHGGSYRRTAEQLIHTLDIDILAFDYRGSGRSSGKRGVVRSYSDLSLDLDAANQWAAAQRPEISRFLLGHSNGGLVALRTVLDRELGLAGLIVSNPSLKLSAHVPTWKRLVGEVLLRIAPTITLQTGLSNEQLTQDPAVAKEISADILRHNRISPPLFFGMKASGPNVLARGTDLRLPILMILGGSDPIIDPAAGMKFFESIGSQDKTLKLYPEMRHEPLNEIGRERVIAAVADWLRTRIASDHVILREGR